MGFPGGDSGMSGSPFRIGYGSVQATSVDTARDSLRLLRTVAGIEPYAALFEKRRRRATFVVKSGKGNELIGTCCPFPFPWSPLESSPVVER